MKKSFLLVLLLLLTLPACCPQHFNTAPAARNSPPAPIPQLMVRGEGMVEATPDLLQLRLGVVSQDVDADVALRGNNERMRAVLAALQEIGIAEDEIATGQFQIRPEWSTPPRPTPANWQRQIVGYRVSNELLVATVHVELAGKLLALSQRAGANQIGGLQFSLADPNVHKQQAITLATEMAIRQAQTMAAAAGVALGPLQSLSLDASGGAPSPQLMMAEARMASVDSVSVMAGKVEVSAAVTLVFRLAESVGNVVD
jgi:uncharacterized protein YggE